MGESVREIRQINREIFIQSVLVMCDTSETQTNAAQETTEASETPVVVELEGVAEPEKREEVVAEAPNDEDTVEVKKEEPSSEPEKKEEVGEAKDNDDSQAEE